MQFTKNTANITSLSPLSLSTFKFMDMESSFSNLHIAILSSPGMGHLIPVVLLADRLAAHHHVNVTVLLVTSTVSPPLSNLLNLSLHHLVQINELPPVDISHLVDSSAKIVTQLCLMVRESLPHIRSAVAAMTPRPDALFVDPFCADALEIAAELSVSKYVYVASNAWYTALAVYTPVLDQQIKGEYVDQTEPLRIPGCKPVRPGDVVDPMLDREDHEYDVYLKLCKSVPLYDGILINSWTDLDPQTIQAFSDNRSLGSVIGIPVHTVGPLTRQVEPDGDSEVTRWLDRQPNESVIFVSFGSGGVLSQKQITELAWGLELSRQRFVWVVRRPTEGRVDDAFFSITNGDDDGTPDYLPRGFLTRTRDVGVLVPKWAPQAEILSHPAIGGFMSHCGWNSTLESITNGVPMIAWPLYAEQRLNAALLSEELKVALQPRTVMPAVEVVGREEVETMVRELMEGEEGRRLREKAEQLKMSGAEALKVGGPSHRSMCEVLATISQIKLPPT